MKPSRRTPADPSALTRRSLLQAGTAALMLGGTAPLVAPPKALAADDLPTEPADRDVEWRNRQPEMAYRRLGRTNLMVSEVVSGGDPITPENFRHLEQALERGLNYLDMAPAYHQGGTEEAYGKLLGGGNSRREKVFLATKVSDYNRRRHQMYREIFDGLPGEKQDAIQKRAEELRDVRGVEKPGYFLTYFPGQPNAIERAYLSLAMRDEYGEKVEGSGELRQVITESLEGSLRRLKTDHVDILMCPHGADTPDELEDPHIQETFQKLKQQGKVRFLGVSSHNDPAGVLRAAVDCGHYDMAMMAYNVVNGGYVDGAIRHAARNDVGMIAMKVAMAVATHHKPLQPVPDWRVQMVERIVPGDLKPPLKAYLWVLQNPRISAVISNLWDETYIQENLALAGRKVELQPA